MKYTKTFMVDFLVKYYMKSDEISDRAFFKSFNLPKSTALTWLKKYANKTLFQENNTRGPPTFCYYRKYEIFGSKICKSSTKYLCNKCLELSLEKRN